MRGRKHFARSERRIVRFRRTTEAQNAAKLSRKSGKAAFSTVSGRGRGLFLLLSMYFVWKTDFRPRLSYHARPVKSKFRSILAFFEALCYSVNGASALRRCHSTVGVSEHPDL